MRTVSKLEQAQNSHREHQGPQGDVANTLHCVKGTGGLRASSSLAEEAFVKDGDATAPRRHEQQREPVNGG